MRLLKLVIQFLTFIHHSRADKANKAIKLTAFPSLVLWFNATLPQNNQLQSRNLWRRWVIGAAPDTVGAEEFARHTETLPRGWGLPRTLYQDLYQKLTARK